ncbi:hypothetical protein, variant [Phytophthora nicotianae CJ01A1]|uniref:Uncharacterized protein n=1 Tax=Phytophthora nicotianae CJ01A1 TaxID=1317063 RepID=W2XI09_PHYNI|nr:hypothetical protein F441_04491 [Phytophthora nicotianae CJ01A1]ETP22137.1 hypothetical protein, variant [Phytophthora nicotianae CJ01A1]
MQETAAWRSATDRISACVCLQASPTQLRLLVLGLPQRPAIHFGARGFLAVIATIVSGRVRWTWGGSIAFLAASNALTYFLPEPGGDSRSFWIQALLSRSISRFV